MAAAREDYAPLRSFGETLGSDQLESLDDLCRLVLACVAFAGL
jgi:hypothetical protein